MRIMHNEHDGHAFRERLRPEADLNPDDYICRHCRREKHHGGGIPACSQPACREPGPAAGTRDVSGMISWFGRQMAPSNSPCGVERFSESELEGLLPRMENIVAPALFDPIREKSHFRISGPDNVCTAVLSLTCVGSTRTEAIKCSLNFFRGRAASRS